MKVIPFLILAILASIGQAQIIGYGNPARVDLSHFNPTSGALYIDREEGDLWERELDGWARIDTLITPLPGHPKPHVNVIWMPDDPAEDIIEISPEGKRIRIVMQGNSESRYERSYAYYKDCIKNKTGFDGGLNCGEPWVNGTVEMDGKPPDRPYRKWEYTVKGTK